MPVDLGSGVGRRAYLKATGALAVSTAGLAGCVGQASGTLATSVTDQPADIGDFESLVVTIDGIWLGPEGAESGAQDTEDLDDAEDDESDENEPSGREYHEFDEPQRADLVELQGDETQLIDERDIDVGEYRFLQLNVSETEGTLVDGDEAAIELPGNAPLTFNEPFEIRENARTSFTADFAPVRRGGTDTYLLRPVPQGIEVTYEDSDDAESNDDPDDDPDDE